MAELGELIHFETDKPATSPTDLSHLLVNKMSRKSEGGKACDQLLSMRGGHYWDDAKGGWLPPELVAKARDEEMGYVRRHRVYERVRRQVCLDETGKQPVKTGWADTNKGTAQDPNIRSRWVAKEFRTSVDPDLFAPTSPLEGIKLVISSAASTGRSDTVILIVDVRRAYFYAPARRRIYVELPPQDRAPGDESMCGLLRVSLYGTRDAASN